MQLPLQRTWVGTTQPEVHLPSTAHIGWPAGQTLPHRPQLLGSERSASQPLPGLPSQSPRRAGHIVVESGTTMSGGGVTSIPRPVSVSTPLSIDASSGRPVSITAPSGETPVSTTTPSARSGVASDGPGGAVHAPTVNSATIEAKRASGIDFMGAYFCGAEGSSRRLTTSAPRRATNDCARCAAENGLRRRSRPRSLRSVVVRPEARPPSTPCADVTAAGAIRGRSCERRRGTRAARGSGSLAG